MRDRRDGPPCPAPARCRSSTTHLPGRPPRGKPEVAAAAARPGPKELRGRAGRARPIHYPALCLRRRRGAEQLPRLGRRGRGAQARGRRHARRATCQRAGRKMAAPGLERGDSGVRSVRFIGALGASGGRGRTPAFSARARPLLAAPRFVPGAAGGGGRVGSEGGGPGSGRFLRRFRPGRDPQGLRPPGCAFPGRPRAGASHSPRAAAERLPWASWSGHGHAVPSAALALSGI